MSTTLIQRRFFTAREFELTGRSLKVITRNLLSFKEGEINFEDISFKKVYQKKPHPILVLICLGAFLGLGLTICSNIFEKNGSSIYDILFYMVSFICLLAASILTFENKLTIISTNQSSVVFFAASKYKSQLNDFLSLLYSEQKQYLLNKYAKDSPYLSKEQLVINLKWLWDRKIIDDSQLAELRIKLLPKPINSQPAGFAFKPDNN